MGKKKFEPEYIEFRLFDVQYGYLGGPICVIAKHLILEELKGSLTKKEIESLEKRRR